MGRSFGANQFRRRDLGSSSPSLAGWRVTAGGPQRRRPRGKQRHEGRGLEVQWFLPRRTSRSGRFLSKPCFYLWAIWSPLHSDLCPGHKVWDAGYSEKTIVCVLKGQLGQGDARSVGCAHTQKLKEQGPCSLAMFFFLGDPCPPVEPVARSSASCLPPGHRLGKAWLWDLTMRLFPSRLPTSALIFKGKSHCPQPRAACFSGLGTAYLESHLVGAPRILSWGGGRPHLGKSLESQTSVLEGPRDPLNVTRMQGP